MDDRMTYDARPPGTRTPGTRTRRRAFAACLALASSLAVAAAARAAAIGTTTVVTHGFQSGEKGAWVEATAKSVLARAGGDGAVYRYDGATRVLTRVPEAGGNGSSANVVVIFNWNEDSGFIDEGPNWNYAQAAGDVMQAMLRDAAYAAGEEGPSDLVSGRVVHLIGHSRGAVVISEAVRRLALAGLPVDQMTTLDPHPVNGTLDARYDLNWGDPVPVRWSNVAWADNVWRADGGGILNGLDFDGMPLANTFDVPLSESLLNCCAYSFSHSDVHLWYFGTIDLAPNPSNGEQTITNTMRNSWWPGGAALLGFHRSAIGGGTRPAIPPGVAPPAGSAPLLENGGFVAGSRAGWAFHGGVGATVGSEGGNSFARLNATRSVLVHNLMHFPVPTAPSTSLRLGFLARRAGSGATNDVLRIFLERADDEAPTPIPGAVWSVSGLGGGFGAGEALIPSEFHGRTALLRIELDGGPDGINSTVELDEFVLEMTGMIGDIDGNGQIDGTDLSILLGTWGDCPSKAPCPADFDGNGQVDGTDLSTLLGGWGTP